MGMFFVISIVLFFIGAIAGFFFRHDRKMVVFVTNSFAAAASVAGAVFALSVFSAPTPFEISFSSIFSAPLFYFYIDRLSAFFILLVGAGGAIVSIFSFGYLARGQHSGAASALLGFLYNLFLCSMILVAAAGNIITFLVAWELMSILSYFLVTYEHRKSENLKAGILYIIMTQIGTVFLMAAFFLFFKETGSFQFSDFRAAGGLMPEFIRNVVFVLALVGFGTKTGMAPFHIWLPEAHPAAPSHVSALMSGIMIKIALYGLLRFIFDFMGGGMVWWWGMAVLIFGAISAIVGVLYALMEHDLKRLLAYHSVENIGIILIGIGSAMLFLAFGYSAFVGLALFAGLFHILNHGIFKSLLFMGAGAIHNATGLKDMEKMGGLAKTMPLTAIFFLMGTMAISALPPLNGFVSEWLVFQGLLHNLSIADPMIKIIVTISIALLALTSALAVACFVKVFGICFLALPRSQEAASAKEAGRTMLFSMSVLAVLCLVLGLFPFIGFSLIQPVLDSLGIAGSPVISGFSIWPVQHLPFGVSPFTVAALFAGIVLAVNLFAIALWGKHKKRKSSTWACGRSIEPRMEYTATGLAMPFKLVFASIYRPTQNIERETLDGTGYLVKTIRYEEKIEPIFEKYLYRPFISAIETMSGWTRAIHSGNINLYLGYIFATLVLLLLIFG